MLGGTVVPNDHGAGSPKVTGNIGAEVTLITAVASLARGGGGYCTIVQQMSAEICSAQDRESYYMFCWVYIKTEKHHYSKGINTKTGELMS